MSLIDYNIYLADNALILAQRNAAWCGHGPVLEQDIAITNISLDLIGQARNFYQYAAELINAAAPPPETLATEDRLAYLRDAREFKNGLLVEQSNGDWAQTILRQFFFSTFQFYLYEQLQNSRDEQIAAIAEKSLKEVSYHLRWSSEWVIRLGDGTDESHQRMKKAIDEIYQYTGELFRPVAFETEMKNAGIGADLEQVEKSWKEKVNEVFSEATLAVPEKVYQHTGGKSGNHSEELGYILAEMQFMQRAYPDLTW